jgi:TolA-binding protein
VCNGRAGDDVMMPRSGRLFLIFSLPYLILSVSGCTVTRPVGNFFGQQYVNTVSYFNTYYNAQRIFDEAVTELRELEMNHLRQNRAGRPDIPDRTTQKFNSVIEKCSRLLHLYPGSRYAEDAVLMIGKSYLYTRQNVQAERKFLELLAEFPDSRLGPEAQLLLARSQKAMNKLDEAGVTLSDLIERIEHRRNRDVIALAYIETGGLAKDAGRLQSAIEAYSHAIETARDRSIRTDARFRRAGIYFEQELTELAYEEFGNVISDRPTSEILFQSHRYRARILASNEEYDAAIDLLSDILTDLRLVDFHSRVELEAADIFYRKGELSDAVHQYVYIDTTYQGTPVAVQAQYALGYIYKDYYNDFQKAEEYFQKATRGTPVNDLVRDARVQNNYLTRYRRYRSEIERLDTTIANQYAMLGDLERGTSAPRDNEPGEAYGDTIIAEEGGPHGGDAMSVDELQSLIAQTTDVFVRTLYDLAGLFFIEMARPDSAVMYYSKLAYEYPESPYAPQALYALAELVRSEGGDYLGTAASFDANLMEADPEARSEYFYRLLIDRYPESEFAAEAERILGIADRQEDEDPLRDVYLAAEAEFLEKNYQSAVYLFEYVIRSSEESEYIPRAIYAVGWIYENVEMNPDSAIAYYQTLVNEHPGSEYAGAVREKLETWTIHLAEHREAGRQEAGGESTERAGEEDADAETTAPAGDEDAADGTETTLPDVPENDLTETDHAVEHPDTTSIEGQDED